MNGWGIALCGTLAIVGSVGFGVAPAHADCSDQWVTKATMEYLHRGTPLPSDPECNITHYNGGHWSSYSELQHHVATYWRATVYPAKVPAAPNASISTHAGCADPAVTQATMEYLHRGVPKLDDPECDIQKYNHGSWKTYAELQHHVATYWRATVYPTAGPHNVPAPVLPGGQPLAGISRQGFNFNSPPCPVSSGITSGTDKFSDGTALPSCTAREVAGNTTTTYKLVWTGHAWAKYPPSTQTVVATAPPAPPGSPDKQGFNGNVPACPVSATITSATDRFSDGTPLPSCGAREVNGNLITTYKLVWLGKAWAKYPPSVKTVTVATPDPAAGPVAGPGQQPPAAGVAVPPLVPTQLLAVPELANLLSQGADLIDNMQAIADALTAGSSGPDALWDPEAAGSVTAAVDAARTILLAPDNPYSLRSLVNGTAFALNAEERRELGTMLAESGFADWLRDANGIMIDAVRRVAPAAVITTDLKHPVRYAQLGGGALTRWSDAHQRLTFKGLDRAQQLVGLLSLGRALQTSSIFVSYSTLVESTISDIVKRRIESLANALRVPGPLTAADAGTVGKLQSLLKTYVMAKVAVKLTGALLNVAADLTPSSISHFYMTVGDRKYAKNLPPYPMNAGDTAITRIYVVPHAPGGSTISPLGAISIIKDAALGPDISRAIDKFTFGAEFAKSMQADFVAIVTQLSRYHVNTILNVVAKYNISKWANAVQNTATIAPVDYKPYEINDDRVVKLSIGPTGGEHIALTHGSDYRYMIGASSAGTTSVVGYLLLTDLYTGADSINLAVEIVVNGPPPPPPPKNVFCTLPDGSGGTISPYTGDCQSPS